MGYRTYYIPFDNQEEYYQILEIINKHNYLYEEHNDSTVGETIKNLMIWTMNDNQHILLFGNCCCFDQTYIFFKNHELPIQWYHLEDKYTSIEDVIHIDENGNQIMEITSEDYIIMLGYQDFKTRNYKYLLKKYYNYSEDETDEFDDEIENYFIFNDEDDGTYEEMKFEKYWNDYPDNTFTKEELQEMKELSYPYEYHEIDSIICSY